MVGAKPGQVRGKLAGFFFHPAGVFFLYLKNFWLLKGSFLSEKKRKNNREFLFFPRYDFVFFLIKNVYQMYRGIII